MSLTDFFSSKSQRARGGSAEEDGALWLEGQGYEILERNVSSRYGEIDVVAIESSTLCFIEIKARRSARFGAPSDAVTRDKQRRLTRCARAYLARKAHDGPCRFDVLGMRPEGQEWRFELVRNAFPAAT